MRAVPSLAALPKAPPLILFRSFLYFLWFGVVSVIMNVGALPTLLMPRRAIVRTSQCWSRVLLWGLKHIAGLDWEVRGTIPQGGVLVASKHMSMWDTLALYMLLDDAVIVLKRELLNVPFYGWYLRKAHMIAIDRAAGASALRQMAAQGKAVVAEGRPIVIFPEGTRKSPGAPPDYKPGVAGLYGLLGVDCVPVALNSGLFWTGPMGFLKKPGRIIIEFLPPIPAGLGRAAFTALLEARTETAAAKLIAEGRTALAAHS
ncbi:MAG: 1-acyl-sn-glycerol-3-phosphate acyltransferase [Alphaproteobacteria bacterium]|nr:1-acyl-sn-glycerol-3-phosphate acyltransferase [Alphaproteobacteria bacterium]